LHKDKAWMELKLYLHETAWRRFEYERNRIYYDITFSMIQAKYNLKPNPYLADTARHLFATAIGAAPGYVPARDEAALPLNLIQKAFIESYGLKKYIPTIMHPVHFDFDKTTLPVYYSLQHPSTYVFSPKSRTVTSTISEIHELEYIMSVFCKELSSEKDICADTIIGKIAKSVIFDYFHNKPDRQRIIKQSRVIATMDPRFGSQPMKGKKSAAVFAADAPFVRGCVSIRARQDVK